MPFTATSMELGTLIWTEISQKEKDKYPKISHIWNRIYGKRKLSTKKEIVDLENRLLVTKGREMEAVLGVHRCRLLPLEWMSNEILLCSTGNCV